MIAVTFALPAESSSFLRRLRKKSRSDQSGIRIIRGEIDDRKIKVLYTGVGETIYRQRMAALLRGRQFKYLISAGFACALSDRLHVGDLFLADNFSTVKHSETSYALFIMLIRISNLLSLPSIVY